MKSRRHCQKPAIIGRFRSGSTAGRIDETLIADSCREQPVELATRQVISEATLGRQNNAVVDCLAQPLLAAEITLGRLN